MSISERAQEIFEALKELEMKPTPGNVSIMHGVYEFLRIIYKEAEEIERERTVSDPGGRDED